MIDKIKFLNIVKNLSERNGYGNIINNYAIKFDFWKKIWYNNDNI